MATTTPTMRPLRWDIFCRVVDNFGDIGVCWRLARHLAAGGDAVRLVADDVSALSWMAGTAGLDGHDGHGADDADAPSRAGAGVTVLEWPGPDDAADIVIEAFGCDPPAAYVMSMRTQATRAADPVWINLEYLSAEDHVERSHGLPSPRPDGLRKWFFYPGFTERTGGLLREPGLMQQRTAFDGNAWLAAHGLLRRPGERVVSLFCYDNTAIDDLLRSLADTPTLLLLTPGAAQRLVQATPAAVRTAALPWLSQTAFDHLLWASDLNCVRGEDSLVRALWAGAPFLWQIYAQQDGAHAAKLQAFLARLALPPEVAAAHLGWNGLASWPGLPHAEAWGRAIEAARSRLLAQEDLVTQLRRFVAGRLRPRAACA